MLPIYKATGPEQAERFNNYIRDIESLMERSNTHRNVTAALEVMPIDDIEALRWWAKNAGAARLVKLIDVVMHARWGVPL